MLKLVSWVNIVGNTYYDKYIVAYKNGLTPYLKYVALQI